MSKTTSIAQTGLLAILLAMVGFSYSLATSNTGDVGDVVAARAVGTNPALAFANPFVTGSTDRDLGDAVAGSSLSRLVRAKGGLAPYTFTAGSLNAAFTLLSNGIFTAGSVPSGLPNPYRFSVTVKDSAGTAPHTVTETFRLTLVNTTQFRFANSALSDGTQYRPYSGTLTVINGKGPYKFSATGLPTGLAVSADGVVFGVPTVSGTFTFTATATDANNKTAASRTGTGTSQSVKITIGAGSSLSSTIIATQITVKAGFGTGKDGVMYKGVANLGAEAIASLSGRPLSFRIGSYTGPTANFDARGNATTAKKVTPSVKASVKKFGVTSITIAKETITTGAITGSTIVLPVEVRLGDAVIGSQSLSFAVKNGRNGAVTLTYKGSVSADIGGSAQLLKVQGADDKAGTGDAWKASFAARIPAAINISSVTSVEVDIGTNYTNTVALTDKNGKFTGKGDRKSPVVSAFSLDSTKKGKGTYTTGVLTKASTGIPLAGTPGTAQAFFANTLTFKAGTTTVVGADSSLAIFAKKTRWSSQ